MRIRQPCRAFVEEVGKRALAKDGCCLIINRKNALWKAERDLWNLFFTRSAELGQFSRNSLNLCAAASIRMARGSPA
jgi:hypothetical protein